VSGSWPWSGSWSGVLFLFKSKSWSRSKFCSRSSSYSRHD
jgi:hypothetical protein